MFSVSLFPVLPSFGLRAFLLMLLVFPDCGVASNAVIHSLHDCVVPQTIQLFSANLAHVIVVSWCHDFDLLWDSRRNKCALLHSWWLFLFQTLLHPFSDFMHDALCLGSQLNIMKFSFNDLGVSFPVGHELVIKGIAEGLPRVVGVDLKGVTMQFHTGPQHQSLALKKTHSVENKSSIHEAKTVYQAVDIPPECIDQL